VAYKLVMAETFREAFIQALEKSGMSIARLSELSSVSVEQLKKLKQRETAKTNVEDARKVAHAFGLSLDEFIDSPRLSAQLEIIELCKALPADLQRQLLSFGKGLAAAQDREDPE